MRNAEITFIILKILQLAIILMIKMRMRSFIFIFKWGRWPLADGHQTALKSFFGAVQWPPVRDRRPQLKVKTNMKLLVLISIIKIIARSKIFKNKIVFMKYNPHTTMVSNAQDFVDIFDYWIDSFLCEIFRTDSGTFISACALLRANNNISCGVHLCFRMIFPITTEPRLWSNELMMCNIKTVIWNSMFSIIFIILRKYDKRWSTNVQSTLTRFAHICTVVYKNTPFFKGNRFKKWA